MAGRERALKFLVKFLKKGFVARGLMETQTGSQVHKTDEEKGIYRRGCSPWEGEGLMDRTVTVKLPGVQRAGRAGGAKRRSETQLQSMAERALQKPGQTGQRERTGSASGCCGSPLSQALTCYQPTQLPSVPTLSLPAAQLPN